METRNKLHEFGRGENWQSGEKKKVTENKDDTKYPTLYFFQYK